jgi:hypothetical protein
MVQKGQSVIFWRAWQTPCWPRQPVFAWVRLALAATHPFVNGRLFPRQRLHTREWAEVGVAWTRPSVRARGTARTVVVVPACRPREGAREEAVGVRVDRLKSRVEIDGIAPWSLLERTRSRPSCAGGWSSTHVRATRTHSPWLCLFRAPTCLCVCVCARASACSACLYAHTSSMLRTAIWRRCACASAYSAHSTTETTRLNILGTIRAHTLPAYVAFSCCSRTLSLCMPQRRTMHAVCDRSRFGERGEWYDAAIIQLDEPKKAGDPKMARVHFWGYARSHCILCCADGRHAPTCTHAHANTHAHSKHTSHHTPPHTCARHDLN